MGEEKRSLRAAGVAVMPNETVFTPETAKAWNPSAGFDLNLMSFLLPKRQLGRPTLAPGVEAHNEYDAYRRSR